ncbi:MAG: hypothetical protein QM790_14665 [Nibricoccus sp.]
MRIRALCILMAAFALGGCFNIRSPKPIAGPVEESFKNRWVAKRMGELQAAGQAKDAREARTMAVEEFRKKFEYTGVSKKPDPVAGSNQ